MKGMTYGDVCMFSSGLPAAVVAKYRTSTSSSSCSLSKLGRIRCWMSSWLRGDGVPVLPDFSKSVRVPSAGRRRNVSISTAYDLATLNRIFGISSAVSRSMMGRMEFSIISKETDGARVWSSLVVDTSEFHVASIYSQKLQNMLSSGRDSWDAAP